MRLWKPFPFPDRSLFFKSSQRWFSLPDWLKITIFLWVLSFLAYGILLPQMGFYWDDWPWIWIQHVDGKIGMLAIDHGFRPLSGVTLWFFSLIAGERPLLWQAINFSLRLLSSVTAYLALSALFPRQKEKAVWAAVLFLLYPAYNHQYVAVNSSRHLLPLVWLLLSVWLMVQNARAEKFSRWRAVAALGLQSFGMLTTEYFYGLELTRPLILWLASDHLSEHRQRLKHTVYHALPYLTVFAAIVIWRYAITRLPGYSNYSINLFDESGFAISANLLPILQEWLRQMYVGLVLGWAKSLELPNPSAFGALKTVGYGLLVLGTAGLMGVFLLKFQPSAERKPSAGLLLFGGIALAVGGLPFLAAGLPMGVNFPASRLTLPMALGSSLLWVGLIERIPIPRWGKICLVAGLSALAVGAHFQNAIAFQRDGAYQRAFFEQLRWRAPQIKPATLILSNVIGETHSSDNSLTAALNLLYFDTLQGEDLPLLFFYVETRQATYFPNPVTGLSIQREYGRFRFSGNTAQSIVLFFEPPACLRLIDPNLDRFNPTVSKDIRQVAHLSNPEQIQEAEPKGQTDFPLPLAASADSWCYFYQRAELARQQGRWEEVVAWGEKGFASGDSPNRADERIPLIQGYALTGNWSRAIELTRQAKRINPSLSPLLCQLWQEIRQKTPSSEAQREAIQEVYQLLNCGEN